MRTTANIDDDVLTTARFLAKRSVSSVGEIVSDLARRALQGSTLDSTTDVGTKRRPTTPLSRKLERLGLVPFKAAGGRKVTDDLVDALRDADGI